MTARLAIVAALALVSLVGCGAGSRAAVPDRAPPQGASSLRASGEPIDGRGLLQEEGTRAAVGGGGALVVLGADVGSEGDRIGAFLEIPEAECALIFARATPTVLDLDLFAYEDEGATFASDESSDPQPTLLLCPPHPRRVYAAARVASGAGIVALGAVAVPRAAAEAVAAASRARARGDDSGRLASWPGLEAKIAERRATLGGRWEDVKRAVVPVDSRVAARVTLPVAAGRCVDVLVSPSEEVGSLEVLAEDGAGRVLARGRDRGRDRGLVLCSHAAAEVSLTLRARASQGVAVVVAARSRVGGEAELAESVPIDRLTQSLEVAPARAALDRALVAQDYAPPITVGTGTARVGSREALSVDLAAGCARVDVVAGRPLGGVVADLWDDRGSRMASARGGAVTTLFACGPAGKARIDLEAAGPPGPFAVELRRSRTAPAALVAHPVAASRLLARLEAGRASGSAVLAAASAEVVALDESSRRTLPLPIAPGSCTEVVVAIGPGGAGVDLRLTDGASTSAAVARARHVVSDRVCAPAEGGAGARAGAIEIGLAAGKADALVLVRTAPVGE